MALFTMVLIGLMQLAACVLSLMQDKRLGDLVFPSTIWPIQILRGALLGQDCERERARGTVDSGRAAQSTMASAALMTACSLSNSAFAQRECDT